MQRPDQTGNLITEFKCKICGEPIRFSLNDPKTYESKTPHKDYFGMQLTTVRVSHEISGERHHNSIVIDQKGLFRGYRDAYVEPITSGDSPGQSSLVVQPGQSLQVTENKFVTLLVMVDRQRFWVKPFLCPEEFRPTELARLVMERVEEAERVYDKMPRTLTFGLADMDIHVWVSQERVVFVAFNNPSVLPALEGLCEGLLEVDKGMSFTNQRAIQMALQVIGLIPDIDSDTIHRLVTDALLFSVTTIPFPDRTNRIVELVSKRFPIASVILRPLLTGKSSIIDLLEDGHVREIRDVFEMVDFINRRGLLG